MAFVLSPTDSQAIPSGSSASRSSDPGVRSAVTSTGLIVFMPPGMKVLAEEVGSLLGAEVVTIRHEPRYDIELDYDYGKVQIAVDGGPWLTLAAFTGCGRYGVAVRIFGRHALR